MLRMSELLKVLELKQALGIPLNEGACFGVRDPTKLRPPFKSLETKEIFVVDGNLCITPVKIPVAVWKRKSRIFTTKIDSIPVIVLRGGWNKLTTYAGFETEQEAKDFKEAVKKYERRRLVEKRKARKNP